MSAVLSHPSSAQSDVNTRLAFQKQLQVVTNKIHATNNVDEIILDVSADICVLFNADRLTIYVIGEDKQSIVSKVKTGLNSFKDLRLPIAEHSIAGYAGMSKRMINIKDVYDDNELRGINTGLRFLQEVDKRTGYRTKQMLVAPIVDSQNQELIGVIQIINNKAGVSFGALAEDGVAELAQTLAIAFRQRQKPALVKTKYDYLISDAVLSAGEFELASRQARKKAVDIEQVLTEEFQVKIPAGVKSGARIKLAGRGEPGPAGGKPGPDDRWRTLTWMYPRPCATPRTTSGCAPRAVRPSSASPPTPLTSSATWSSWSCRRSGARCRRTKPSASSSRSRPPATCWRRWRARSSDCTTSRTRPIHSGWTTPPC